jgi:ubiquinone/menaquinone biosynthesis C-methylase UbiE
MTWLLRTSALLATLLVTAAVAAQQRTRSESVATAKIFEALAIREGHTVCEIGAGDGELSIAAAKLVGSAGRVYTSELGDDRVKTLQQKVTASGLAHVTVVEGDATKTKFPDAACDALFMRNVYHHFEDPAAMNNSIAAALKPGGRVAVVDFTPPGKEADLPTDRDRDGMHGISAESLSRELKSAGLEPVSSELGSERWFMVVVSKPKL